MLFYGKVHGGKAGKSAVRSRVRKSLLTWLKWDNKRGYMAQDKRKLLDVLKFELDFLEKGGYGKGPMLHGGRTSSLKIRPRV